MRRAAVAAAGFPVVLVILLTLVALPAPAGVQAAPANGSDSSGSGVLQSEVQRQADEIGLGEVDRFLAELDREMAGDLPPLRVADVIDMLLRREGAYTVNGFLAAVANRLGREVLAAGGLLGRLIVLALLCGLLQNIQSAFTRAETSRLAFGACYLVLVIMAIGAFLLATDVCRGVVNSLVDFMQAMLPVLVTLLAGLGAVTTAGLLHPVLIAAVEVVAELIRDVILPVVLCAASIDLVSRTFSGVKLTALADTLKQGAVLVTGLVFTLFLGTVSIYGAAGAVFDGASIKAAKFAAGALVPFIGKLLADAMEVVMTSSLVLKNVVGVVGALAIVAYTVFPLLKVLSLVIAFRVAAAVVQPLGAGELVASMTGIGNSLVLMMVMALAVAMMFLIALAVVVGAATAAVMVR